jgi:hypothetical protein
MKAFRVILLATLTISYIGGIAGQQEDKKSCIWFFGSSGALFLLSFVVEKLL